ncbi:MAG: hypothetical protein ACKOZU_02615 [Planctomycetaceae bacterium]
MPIIARIPDVSEREDAAPRREAHPERAWRPLRRAGFLARLSDAWPTWPVAALAVVAVVSWFLASWNDHVRLERQRSEVRLASEPAASEAASTSPPATGGAVVR